MAQIQHQPAGPQHLDNPVHRDPINALVSGPAHPGGLVSGAPVTPAPQPFSTSSPSTSLSAVSLKSIQPPGQTASTTASATAAALYSPTTLMGLAVSALQQPEGSSAATSAHQAPTVASHQTPSAMHTAPPSLRVTTNIGQFANSHRNLTASATSTPTPKQTFQSSTTTPITSTKLNYNNPYLAANMGPASVPRAAPDSTPTSAHPPTAGKRPSIREIEPLDPETAAVEKALRRQKIRDVVTEQFGLEILLKHRELQDIEAELGKAEACLEQVRRCSIESAMERDGLRNGTAGVAMTYSPAASVLNGPHSCQYKGWLNEQRVSNNIRSNHDVLAADQSKNFVPMRRRGIEMQNPFQTGSGRPQREAAQHAQPKRLICLHRQLDGTVLKLTCIDCGRYDFGSAQGFINHCRLAHGRDFQTHEEAARACGAPFDATGFEDNELPPVRSARALKNNAAALAARKNSKATKTHKIKQSSISAAPSKALAAPTLADMTQTGPLTPPLQADDISHPKVIKTSHLKIFLNTKNVEVDNIDVMAEEAVNRVGVVEDSEDDESIDEAPKPNILQEGSGRAMEGHVLSRTTVSTTNQIPAVDEDTEMTEASSGPQSLKLESHAAENTGEGANKIEPPSPVYHHEPVELSSRRHSVASVEDEAHGDDQRPTSSSSRRSTMTTRSNPRSASGVASQPTRMATRSQPTGQAQSAAQPAAQVVTQVESPSKRHSARIAEHGTSPVSTRQ